MIEPSPSTQDFSNMTKNELLGYAAENGVDGVDSSMRKAEIIEMIRDASND